MKSVFLASKSFGPSQLEHVYANNENQSTIIVTSVIE